MKTTALIERGKDGTYGIFTPDIQHTIIGEGNSVAEAKADFENSIQEILAYYIERNRPIPTELKDIEFEYKFDMASIFNYYKFINVSQFAKVTGISPTLMRQYQGGKSISAKRTKKIEDAFHKIAKEMAEIKLTV